MRAFSAVCCVLAICGHLLAQQPPVVYVVVTPGSTYTNAVGAAGGTLSEQIVRNTVGGGAIETSFDIYIRGDLGTPFQLQWNCTDTASATVNADGFYATGVAIVSSFNGVNSGNCAGDPTIAVFSFTGGPTSLQKTVSNSGIINGTTSAKTTSNPAFPGVTYSYATSFGEFVEMGGTDDGGSLNNGIPYVGVANLDVSVSFTANIVRPDQRRQLP